MTVPEFTNKNDLFAWLRANKHLLITEKKSRIKHADAVMFNPVCTQKSAAVNKSDPGFDIDEGTMKVKVVINTTNIMDSHYDVHLPGIWKKSLSENKRIYHLQEHEMKFDHVISDRVTATAQAMNWQELGFDFPGTTEALVFDSVIEKERNEDMAESYQKGYVKNHSVGMIYIKMELAINSTDSQDAKEKAEWDKWIKQIANRAEVEERGYFWAVYEAKVIEGSAVVMGSNYATPTLSTGKDIALDGIEPTKVTHEIEPLFGLKFLTTKNEN